MTCTFYSPIKLCEPRGEIHHNCVPRQGTAVYFFDVLRRIAQLRPSGQGVGDPTPSLPLNAILLHV